MLSMNSGSMGEMPPSTRGRRGRSAWIASAASVTISANLLQSGSSAKSQWDLLLGSFHSIAASITVGLPRRRVSGARPDRGALAAAQEHLGLGPRHQLEARAAQHG